MFNNSNQSGWWLTYISEKYSSVGMMTFTIYGKIIQMFQTTNQSECCSWGWSVASGLENTNRNACSTKTYQDYINIYIFIGSIYIYYPCQSSGPRFSKTDSGVLVNIRKYQISMSKTRSEKCPVMPLKYDHVCWGCW